MCFLNVLPHHAYDKLNIKAFPPGKLGFTDVKEFLGTIGTTLRGCNAEDTLMLQNAATRAEQHLQPLNACDSAGAVDLNSESDTADFGQPAASRDPSSPQTSSSDKEDVHSNGGVEDDKEGEESIVPLEKTEHASPRSPPRTSARAAYKVTTRTTSVTSLEKAPEDRDRIMLFLIDEQRLASRSTSLSAEPTSTRSLSQTG